MSAGLRKPLTGVALLRREHARTHSSLRVNVATLTAAGKGNRFTREDVETLAREGCGVCDSAKMRRRRFTLQTAPVDKTPAPVGKRWVADVLSLRIPSAFYSFTKIRLYVESAVKLYWAAGMHGETVEDIQAADQKLRAFVRATHGEIMMIKQDSHPSHRALTYQDMLAKESITSQLSPGGVHEGVGDPEVAFSHLVPTANAMLLASADFDETHAYSAIKMGIAVHNNNAQPINGEPLEKARTVLMRYLNVTNWLASPLYVYAAPAKAFVHPEFRKSKYDEKAIACVYAGPEHFSDSGLHASVWDGTRYRDVDVGCLIIDERNVIARTAKDHPSHQPFGQHGNAAADVPADLTTWYDPNEEQHPATSSNIRSCCATDARRGARVSANAHLRLFRFAPDGFDASLRLRRLGSHYVAKLPPRRPLRSAYAGWGRQQSKPRA